MTPLTLEIELIIDHGEIVSLIGIDQATGKAAAVHVDHRPRDCLCEPLQTPGEGVPAKFAARGVIVAVEFGLIAVAGEVGL